MDQLLQRPRPDAGRLVAPAAGAGPVWKAEQGHHHRPDIAEVAGVDQRLEGAPLTRQPQLVADRQQAPRAPGGGDQPVARRERRGQRLLEQHVLAGLQRRHADLGVQVVRHDDVHDVDVAAREERAIVEVDGGVGEIAAGGGGGPRAPAGDRPQRGAGRLGDRARVMATPQPVADEPEAHAQPFSAPATSPRTTYFCSSSTSASVGARPSRQIAIMSVKKTK